MSKALVTGGAGFIGSHLCERLLGGGWEVYALDDLSTSSTVNVERLRDDPCFHLVVDSVLSRAVVNELIYKCDVVYHLAAAVGVKLIVTDPVRTILTNVQGTENVLEQAARFSKPVLLASTSEVYGDHRERRPLAEEDRRIYGPTTQRRWLYADSKAMDEHLALAYCAERGLRCVIARLFNTVGPRQSGEWGMVIPRFVEAALQGAPLEVHGDGEQTRCFCHVEDTTRALVALMEWGTQPRSPDGAVFNVGADEPISVLELAHRVIEMTDSSSAIQYVPYDQVYGQGIEDMRHRAPDIFKIGTTIGWLPEHDLERILRDVIVDTALALNAPPLV